MAMRQVTDQMGFTVSVPEHPQRIVSLVPSQTELLCHLGLEQEVVGITKFCVHPEHWRKTKVRIGGTKNFHFDTLRSLAPDLVIGNKEENYAEGIERIREFCPVWMSDVVTLNDARAMIRAIGEITHRAIAAMNLIESIESEFLGLTKLPPLNTLYLIWRNPWMGAGADTFIHALMQEVGLRNALEEYTRYPELTEENLRALSPEVILLSSEPFPFSAKHIPELQRLSPQATVLLVDGELFSWYGSRLLKFPAYVSQLAKRLRQSPGL